MSGRVLKLEADCPTEDVEAQWLYGRILSHLDEYPEMAAIFHVPNGGFRNAREAHKLKCMGTKPGVPDYIWPLPRGGYHGMALELKRTKGGTLDPEQKKWRDWLLSQGYFWRCCKGCQQAWEALLEYYHLPN